MLQSDQWYSGRSSSQLDKGHTMICLKVENAPMDIISHENDHSKEDI